jgi:hypothetical protein
MRASSLAVLAPCLSCFCISTAQARILEDWPYDKLYGKADLIVIAVAKTTKPVADRFRDPRWPLDLVGQQTAFEIKQVLRGKITGKSLDVLHFAFGPQSKKQKEEQLQIIDGPLLIRFRTKSVTLNIGGREHYLERPDYMLFLKRRADGRFEPVSGRIDPVLSIREVFQVRNAEVGDSGFTCP